MLDHFRVVRLGIVLRARDPIRLPPYAGSTLRGAFGHAFRRVACPFRQCPPCLVPASCPYTYPESGVKPCLPSRIVLLRPASPEAAWNQAPRKRVQRKLTLG